jgi:hypothetical protein
MLRTTLGICIGYAVGFAFGFLLIFVFHDHDDLGWGAREGTFTANYGAVTGAIAGGVGDILTYLRRRFGDCPKDGMEADYREPPMNKPS